MVYTPSYLMQSRHGVYYFRVPVPRALHPQGKADSIQVSLKTRCRREALALAGGMRYSMAQTMKILELGTMDYIEAKKRIQEYYKAKLEVARKKMLKDGYLSGEQVRSAQAFIQNIDDGEATAVSSTDILGDVRRAVGLEPCHDEGEQINQEILKCLRLYHTQRLEFSHELSQPDYDSGAVNVAQSIPVGQRESAPLSEAMERYIHEHDNVWRAATKRDYQTYVNFLYQVVGKSVAVGSLSFDHVDMVRDKLDAGQKAVTTKKKYVTFYQTFFTWCKGQGYRKELLFEHVKFKGKEGTKDKRGFDEKELQSIYARLQEYRVSCDTSKQCKIHNYWVAVLLMFSGARLNEIAQLYVANICEKNGIHYIDINDTSENQKVKTDSSKRHVPIHQDLIDLGFLKYVESIRKSGSDRLFPKLSYLSVKGEYGKNVSRWFNNSPNGVLTKLGLKSPQLDMHSLRRAFISTLERAGEKEALIASVVGHGKKTVTQRYNDGYILEQKLRAVSLFKVPK